MKTDTIYHNTFHKFNFKDRIRILVGKKLTVTSRIETEGEAKVTGSSKAEIFVDPIFPKKPKGQGWEGEVSEMLSEKEKLDLITPPGGSK